MRPQNLTIDIHISHPTMIIPNDTVGASSLHSNDNDTVLTVPMSSSPCCRTATNGSPTTRTAGITTSALTNSSPGAASSGASVSCCSPPTRPGAYLTKNTKVESTVLSESTYNVTIPVNVRPGQIFSFRVSDRQRTQRVQCPRNTFPGEVLKVTLPPEPIIHTCTVRLPRMAVLTAASEDATGGGAIAMTPEIHQVNQYMAGTRTKGAAHVCCIRVPKHVSPGVQFTCTDVTNSDQSFQVTCPDTAGPNDWIVVAPPVYTKDAQGDSPTLDFQVEIPPDVRSGELFYAMIHGQRVLVPCPPDVAVGQTVLCRLPFPQIAGKIQLAYESQGGGWYRTINLANMKFQWVRLDCTNASTTTCSDADNDLSIDDFKVVGNASHFTTLAYVRQINYLVGNDDRMRTGRLDWIPADEALVDSCLTVDNNRTLLSYADIAAVQGQPLDKKATWFQNICRQLTPAWNDGHIHVVVRREHLLLDSVDAVMSLGMGDLRKPWRMEFLGEPGLDLGGVTREWFELVTVQLFDPDFGLWLSSANNQLRCHINPASGTACPNDHLIYFRFLGRVLGRALFDRQLVKGHMVRVLYKHLLGWPISFVDLQAQDETYYESLRRLSEMDDVSSSSLDFTLIEERMGVRDEVELVDGGALREVTNENLEEYMEANLRYRMLDRTKLQLTELLLGFFDVVPASALTVFDANELELILCGLPEIDMMDWQAHTHYSGIYQDSGSDAQVVEWFWQIVEANFDQEMKARLLQFVTGTSGVPSRGFSVLQGVDGNIKKFTINGVDRGSFVFPRAHTCFNRIDLPDYPTKKELYDRLMTAVTMCAVGFGMQ